MSWWQDIKRRRVPQALGIYLGASWGVVQFVDWVVKRYLLSPAVTDAALLVAVCMAPTVLILAWRHGAPGPDPWGRIERLGIPLNLLAIAILLLLVFDGEDLQAATRTVVVTDEDGQVQERQVPKRQQRRQVLLFFWDNETGDPAADWLQYGLAEVLALDLTQDPFVEAWTPFSGFQRGGILTRMDRAGYGEALEIPFALQRQIAQDYLFGFFLSGRLEQGDQGFELVATLYGVESTEVLAEYRSQGVRPIDQVDELAIWLKEEMGVPRGSEKLAPDLRVTDRLSESTEALELYVGGRTARLLRNDFAAAIRSWERAVELDPSFALAWVYLGQSAADRGDMPAATEYLRQAMSHNYKLTEREQFVAKALRYFFQGNVEKTTAVYEMWADLYPEDTDALAALANTYIWAGHRLEDAAAAYQKLYEVDPRESWVLVLIGDLLATLGRSEEAREWYERHLDEDPNQELGWRRLGRLQVRTGELETAAESFERAVLESEGSVVPILDLANLALRRGDRSEALERRTEAAGWANEPRSRSLVLRAEIETATLEGRLEDALELVPELVEAESSFRTPTNVLGDVEIRYLPLMVEAGREAEALARLEELKPLFKPPFDVFLAVGGIWVHLMAEDPDAAEALLPQTEAFLLQWKRNDELYLVDYAKGRIAELREEPGDAAELLRKARDGFTGSVQSLRGPMLGLQLRVDLARCLRLTGELAEASAQLDEVLLVFPAFPEAHLEKAHLASASGDEAAARSSLDRALDFWADADEAYDLAREARHLRAELGNGAV